MAGVACSGTESSLYLCSSLPLGNNNCDHFQDAGVNCTGTNIINITYQLQILHDFKFRECIFIHLQDRNKTKCLKTLVLWF